MEGDTRHRPGGHDHDQSTHAGGQGGKGEGPGSGEGTRWGVETKVIPAETGDHNLIVPHYILYDADGNEIPYTKQDLKHLGAIEVSKNMTPEQKAALESDLDVPVSELYATRDPSNPLSPGEILMTDEATRIASGTMGLDTEQMTLGVALQAAQVGHYLANGRPPRPAYEETEAVAKAVDQYDKDLKSALAKSREGIDAEFQTKNNELGAGIISKEEYGTWAAGQIKRPSDPTDNDGFRAAAREAQDRLSKNLTRITGVDQAAGFAGALNRDWKESASSYMSTAAQVRLAERRGMDMAETGRGGDRYPRSMGWRASGDIDAGIAFGAKYGRAFDAVADAQYAHTQAVFKAAGITEVKLYRGVGRRVVGTDPVTMGTITVPGPVKKVAGGPTDKYPDGTIQLSPRTVGRPIDIALNPMSSWSERRSTAANFTGGGSVDSFGQSTGGHVVAATVPVHQIQATAFGTGMGSFGETEYIVMGPNEWANQYGSGIISVIPEESRMQDTGPVYDDGTINLDHPDMGGPDWIKQVASPVDEEEDEEMDVEATIEPRHLKGKHDQSTHGSASGSKVGSYVEGTGTKDDPIRTNNTAAAAKALAEGKHVQLEQERQVSTLINKLDRQVRKAKAAGEDAPNINLCGVSVKGSNLFCEESKGVPRVRMPQLKGKPLPGSAADKLPKNDKGEVDLGPGFIEHMAKRGITTSSDRVPANVLKASQNELNGAKVAGMTKAIENGTMSEGSIYVTKDDYVVDGHHRWAANVSAGIAKGSSLSMPVEVIDADIITVLAAANNYTHSMGIPSAGVNAAPPTQQRSIAEAMARILARPRRIDVELGRPPCIGCGDADD